MAYSPIEQGRLLNHPVLQRVAASHGVTPTQLAIAWVIQLDGVNAIPKASTQEHTHAFPPPTAKRPLEML
ncbi:hypothetical protein KSX_64750 [Ktedonospora formicarum]|uniref:NADP-dependent oxidoreductase domain-containing protein n=1 Tax=Ktedonospora formicarum TaxID=2778364 RepID=A0A8J3MTJ9_9CHLR|nr:aldo/keto reductase [Ktedonospora formicarum]GHO48312.1 hypothetical protein KSX_64750 [Ktedonospora formicarum]